MVARPPRRSPDPARQTSDPARSAAPEPQKIQPRDIPQRSVRRARTTWRVQPRQTMRPRQEHILTRDVWEAEPCVCARCRTGRLLKTLLLRALCVMSPGARARSGVDWSDTRAAAPNHPHMFPLKDVCVCGCVCVCVCVCVWRENALELLISDLKSAIKLLRT